MKRSVTLMGGSVALVGSAAVALWWRLRLYSIAGFLGALVVGVAWAFYAYGYILIPMVLGATVGAIALLVWLYFAVHRPHSAWARELQKASLNLQNKVVATTEDARTSANNERLEKQKIYPGYDPNRPIFWAPNVPLIIIGAAARNEDFSKVILSVDRRYQEISRKNGRAIANLWVWSQAFNVAAPFSTITAFASAGAGRIRRSA